MPWKFFYTAAFFLLTNCVSSPDHYVVTKTTQFSDSIVSAKEYPHFIHVKPYILKNSSFIIFGAIHTRDPKHFQLELIKNQFQNLNPTVVLVEGGGRFLSMNPVKTGGEGAFVRQLARQKSITVFDWDLTKQSLAQNLLMSQRFSAEQIALAQILNPYFGQMRFGKPTSPDEFIIEYIGRAEYVGLEKEINSPADVDRIWKKHFPNKDWRTVDDRFPLPGFLSEISNFNTDLRNRQLILAIKELTSKNERVFVICGNAHAFCIAPALSNGQLVTPEEMISFLWNDPEQLNNLAWDYFQNKTNSAEIELALTWIDRSIELKPGYENHDTRAWLLYKLGQKAQARVCAIKAINIALKEGKNFDETTKLINLLNTD